ncbi:MAG: hypothetical protein DRP94_07300 [Candidatus Latescibacterota bacterium]|nr:MAG: hypothetical protein DRP94_07300 [Candidatus Latescibacterota bacterium]
MRTPLVFALILIFTLIMAAGVTSVSPKMAVALGVGVAIFVACLASTELALYMLIFSMLLSPEIVVGRLGGGAALGRGVTLRLDDFLLLLVGFGWFVRTAIYKELGLFARTPLNRPILYYIGACVLSTGVGSVAGRVELKTGFFFVLKYIEYFIIYFMAANFISERKHIRYFLTAILATCAVVSVVGVLQIPSGGRVTAPFEGEEGEPNTFGGYLVLMLSVVAGLFLTSKSGREKMILAALGLLIVVPFLATRSRGSYVAVVPMVLALLAYSEKKVPIVATLVLVLLASPFVLPKKVMDRIMYTFTQRPEPGQIRIGNIHLDTSTSARLRSWRDVLVRDWIDHPLLGYGVTGYKFLDAQLPRVLIETGLVGLATFVWLIYSLFVRARDTYRRARDPLFKGLSLGFLAGLMAMLGHSVGCNTFIIVRIMEPFWFLAAMVMKVPEIEAEASSR